MNFGRADPFGVWRQQMVDLLDPALARAGSDWAEVDGELKRGHAVLWLAITEKPIAAMITRRRGHIMSVWFAGGKVLSGCLPFLLLVEAEAKQNGMTEARLTGRTGWERVLKDLGWSRDGDDLVKEL